MSHQAPSEMSFGIVENFSTPAVVRSTFSSKPIGTAGPLRKIWRMVHFSAGVFPAVSSSFRPVGWGYQTHSASCRYGPGSAEREAVAGRHGRIPQYRQWLRELPPKPHFLDYQAFLVSLGPHQGQS